MDARPQESHHRLAFRQKWSVSLSRRPALVDSASAPFASAATICWAKSAGPIGRIEFLFSNVSHVYPLENEVDKQNNYEDGPNAYSENIHFCVLCPLICYGRGLISFRSPTVTPPEAAAVDLPGPHIKKAVQIIGW